MTDGENLQAMFKAIAAERDARDWDSGCDRCEADLEMKLDAVDPLILHVWVRHEDDCPFFLARRPTGA